MKHTAIRIFSTDREAFVKEAVGLAFLCSVIVAGFSLPLAGQIFHGFLLAVFLRSSDCLPLDLPHF